MKIEDLLAKELEKKDSNHLQILYILLQTNLKSENKKMKRLLETAQKNDNWLVRVCAKKLRD